jgi:hypothetical protein
LRSWLLRALKARPNIRLRYAMPDKQSAAEAAKLLAHSARPKDALECGREAAAFVVQFVQSSSFAAALQRCRHLRSYRVEFIRMVWVWEFLWVLMGFVVMRFQHGAP